MVRLKVEITRCVNDESWPSFVECELIDAHGRCWQFVDKATIFSADEELSALTTYPRPGEIACEIVRRERDAAGSEIVLVDTERPWGVESVNGDTRFEVFSESLVEE